MNSLRINELHKRFGSHSVLADLDLEVPAGSLTAILGPSGSGKTTLLRLLAGFETPDRGTIRIGEQVIDAAGHTRSPRASQDRLRAQEGGLFPHLSVEANVAFGLSRAARRQGVPICWNGGVGRAGAPLSPPALRWPATAGRAGPGARHQTGDRADGRAVRLAGRSSARRGQGGGREDPARIVQTTTLLVTHDQDEALSLADLVAVLRNGRIAQCATPQELYAWPVDDELASFIGEANVIAGVLDGRLVDTPLGKLATQWRGQPLPSGSSVRVLIRPEQIDMAATDGEEGLTGKIVRCGYHGHDAVLHVQIDEEHGERQLTVRTAGEAPPAPGSKVRLDVRGPVLVWAAPSTDGPPEQLLEQ